MTGGVVDRVASTPLMSGGEGRVPHDGRLVAQPRQFTSTFVIAYTDSRGQTLTGTPGFVAAIRDGYFQVVAYNGAVTPGVDAAVAHALQNSRSYRLAKIVLFQGAFAHAPYYIWVKR